MTWSSSNITAWHRTSGTLDPDFNSSGGKTAVYQSSCDTFGATALHSNGWIICIITRPQQDLISVQWETHLILRCTIYKKPSSETWESTPLPPSLTVKSILVLSVAAYPIHGCRRCGACACWHGERTWRVHFCWLLTGASRGNPLRSGGGGWGQVHHREALVWMGTESSTFLL